MNFSRISVAALGALVALAANAVAADPWSIDYDKSSLGFIGSQQGAEFEGSFSEYTVDVLFSEDDLEGSKVSVEIDLSSVDAGSSDRNGALPGKDWFNVKAFPKATFVAEEFAKGADGGYVAYGVLTIKGVSKPVELPFTLAEEAGATVMRGEAELIRTDFNIGEGNWSSDAYVAFDVTVVVELVAEKL